MLRAIQLFLLAQAVTGFVAPSSVRSTRSSERVVRQGWFDKESGDPRDKLNPSGSYGNPGKGNAQSKVQAAKQGRQAAQQLPVWGLAGAGAG